MDWGAVGSIIGGTGVLGSLILGVNRSATQKRAAFHSGLDDRFSALEQRIKDAGIQTREDHDAVRAQIRDIASTMAGGYVQRREFDSQMTSLTNAVNMVGHQVTEAENRALKQLGDIGRRVDQLFERRNE